MSKIRMSFSFQKHEGSAPSAEIATGDGTFQQPERANSAFVIKAAVRAAIDARSDATEHARHLEPRSGLLKTRILPVIYTTSFRESRVQLLQFTKGMVERREGMGI